MYSLLCIAILRIVLIEIVHYITQYRLKLINMKGKNMEKLYTAEEVRVALKMKMPTIRSWIHQQRLPVVRAGRSVRIRESVLIKIIEEGLDAVKVENNTGTIN